MIMVIVEGNRLDDRANDPFEPVEHRTCTNSFDRVRPLRAMTNASCVAVTVRKTESHHEPPCRIGAEGVNKLPPQQTQRCGGQNHDSLILKASHAFVRTEVQQLCELQLLRVHSAQGQPEIRDAAGIQAFRHGFQVSRQPPATTTSLRRAGSPCRNESSVTCPLVSDEPPSNRATPTSAPRGPRLPECQRYTQLTCTHS